MNVRKVKKNWVKHNYWLWNRHGMIKYVQRSSRYYGHPRDETPKFPHRKWAQAVYLETRR